MQKFLSSQRSKIRLELNGKTGKREIPNVSRRGKKRERDRERSPLEGSHSSSSFLTDAGTQGRKEKRE